MREVDQRRIRILIRTCRIPQREINNFFSSIDELYVIIKNCWMKKIQEYVARKRDEKFSSSQRSSLQNERGRKCHVLVGI